MLTRNEIVDTLLDSYEAYYNIYKSEDENARLVARCEYYEKSQSFAVSKKATLWEANCEEFIYLFSVDTLDMETFKRCRDFAYEDGMERAHIGPGHMYTYITPIFVCESASKEAMQALRKCRIYKNFKFSLHGWMDFHVAACILDEDKFIITNPAGKCVGKTLKKVLRGVLEQAS